MIRTFRYTLRPTKAQEATLSSWLELCRRLYNAALEQRITAWRQQRKSVSRYDQQKDLTVLRAADHEYAALPAQVARSALAFLDRSYNAFLRRVGGCDSPGFPRFRGYGRYSTIAVPTEAVRVVDSRVRFPILGFVRFHEYRKIEGKILETRVTKSSSRWLVSFVCDVGPAPEKCPVRPDRAVGIDLGLTSLAVMSDGKEIKNPRFFKRGEALLASRQQALSRKTPGSNSRARARRLVGLAHEHVANQRLDFVRKTAAELFSRFDLVAHEALQIKGLAQGRNSKSVHDAAWGVFLRCLASKAECAGKWAVPVDPCGTSQRCSACGATVAKGLWEREHRCPCGLRLGRDHNAALNVLALGRSAAPIITGVAEAGRRYR